LITIIKPKFYIGLMPKSLEFSLILFQKYQIAGI